MIVCQRAMAQALRSGRIGVFDKGYKRRSSGARLRPPKRSAGGFARESPMCLMTPRTIGSTTGSSKMETCAAHSVHRRPVPQSSRQASDAGSRAPQNLRRGNSVDPAETSTYALAQAAMDLEALRSILADFDGCALKRTATQLVFADGVPGSRVMFVGEAPGGDEDRIGRPFVGRAGQLLDRMLSAIGLDRQKVYIANVVPWRPPGNRTPTPQETQICLPFLERQIQLADPEYLVCLGGSASRTMLGAQGIMRARGSWFAYSDSKRSRDPGARYAPSGFLVTATSA